ncbi:MAG: 4Fe-4S dicluster domain-containing protein [Bacteroidales bacterium]|jgi:polyferredoxin|nr:4Fe-4S dicluster domain-containing protein [Bacteroidales bacterium]
MKTARTARIVIAALFFIVITLSFISFSAGKLPFSPAVEKFQFGPALMALFVGSALPMIVLLLVTILFGRVYCSFLCPLGIWQDIVIWIADRFKSKKKRRRNYRPGHNTLRYIILGVVAAAMIAGISYPFAFLDPYSIFGRIVTSFNPYTSFAIWSFVLALAFFLLVTLLSAFRGRLYCNTICPVGSFLGLLSSYSMFRLVISEKQCVECSLCGKKCKAQALDSATRTIDYSRCVMCFDCTVSCKQRAITLKYAWGSEKYDAKADKKASESKGAPESIGRRNALIALGTLGLVATSRKWGSKFHSSPALDASGEPAVHFLPPGAFNLQHLKEHCTACHACVAVCPSKIIKPSISQHGIDGFLMPLLSFDEGYCRFDCNKCSNVCPNGALMPLTLNEKRSVRIGMVKFVAKNCLVFRNDQVCGKCGEVCPTGAIKLQEHKRKPGLFYPVIKSDLCIGCGGCTSVCPAEPLAMEVHAIERQIPLNRVAISDSLL